MKNKVLFILVFVLLFAFFMPRPVMVNAFYPTPYIKIVVINPPSDLELTIRYTKDSITETRLLDRDNVAWETNFEMVGYRYLDDTEHYSNGVLIVKSKEYSFELFLPDESFEKYDTKYILDLKSQTLSEEYPAWRMPLTISIRIILTLLVEFLVFFLFAYREKRSWIICIIVNLITQSVLHTWIGILGSNFGTFFEFIFGVVIVFVVEMIAFTVALKEHSKWKAVAYTLVGNLLSNILGFLLLAILPF